MNMTLVVSHHWRGDRITLFCSFLAWSNVWRKSKGKEGRGRKIVKSEEDKGEIDRVTMWVRKFNMEKKNGRKRKKSKQKRKRWGGGNKIEKMKEEQSMGREWTELRESDRGRVEEGSGVERCHQNPYHRPVSSSAKRDGKKRGHHWPVDEDGDSDDDDEDEASHDGHHLVHSDCPWEERKIIEVIWHFTQGQIQ